MEEERKEWQLKLAQTKTECDRIVAEKDSDIRVHKDMIVYLEHRHDAVAQQSEEEHTFLTDQVRHDHLEEIVEQKRFNLQLKKEQDALMRGMGAMEREKKEQRENLPDIEMKVHQLEAKVQDLNRSMSILKTVNEERGKALAEKEKSMHEFRSKISSLTKSKEFLDFKLMQANENLLPKEARIEELQSNLSELEENWAQLHEKQVELDYTMANKESRLAQVHGELTGWREKSRTKDVVINDFKTALRRVVDEKDMRQWPRLIRSLAHQFCEGMVMPNESKEETLELQRHLRMMEKKVQGMAMQGGKVENSCKLDNLRMREQNSVIIHELNKVRMEKKAAETQLVVYLQRVKSLEGQVHAQTRQSTKVLPRLSPSASEDQVRLTQSQSLQSTQTHRFGIVEGRTNLSRSDKKGKLHKGPIMIKSETDLVKTLQRDLNVQTAHLEDARILNLALQEQLKCSLSKPVQ